MPMSRTALSILALALFGQLTACAQPAAAPAAPAASPAAAAAPAPLVAAPLAPAAGASAAQAAAAPDGGQPLIEPIVIRGNDRLVAPPRVAVKPPAGGTTSLKFEAAPAAEVVKVMLNDLLKVDYVVHPPLNGTITLTTRQAVSADRALLLLETALQANGIVMARDSRGTYHVGTPEALRGVVSAPALAEPGKPLPPGYGAVIIPLQYLGAGEMANILRPLVSPDAIVRVDTLRNILVMRGTRAEAEGWLDLVSTFDVNLLRGMSVGVFPLKHTTAAEVEAAMRLLSGGTTAGAAGAAAAGTAPAAGGARTTQTRPAAGQQQAAGQQPQGGALGEASPLFGALRVMPIERINAVLVVTPRAAYLDEARYWIEQFDRPNLNSAEPQLFVYKVQNGSADHLAELLNGIYGEQTQAFSGASGVAPGLGTAGANTNVNTSFASQFGTSRNQQRSFGTTAGSGSPFGTSSGFGLGAGGGLGGAARTQTTQQGAPQGPGVVTSVLGQGVRVMADRINNTLLIHATAAEYQRIEGTLKRLDIQRAQVLIEASIVEVTLGDGLEYGLQWAFNNGLGGGRGGAGVLNNNPTTALTPTGGRYGLGGAAAQGFTYAISNGAGSITAMLSALASKSLIKVISSPSLLVLDNHTATMAVGTQQPINIGTTVSGTSTVITTNNIQYKDTGVMLGVTPSVSAGDLVTLDISQAVTDVGAKDPITGQVTFLQRQVNSQVAVRSGETLALGGLIKDNSGRTSSGLPVLSAIPVIGGLFGTQSKSNTRTELLIVFTPRVVRSDDDARAISRELRDRMQGLMEPLPTSSRQNRP